MNLRGHGLAIGIPFREKAKAGSSKGAPVRGSRISVPKPLSLYYAAEFGLGLALLLYFGPRLDLDGFEILTVLIALSVLAELLPINIYGRTHIAPSFIFTTAIIILFGPPGVVVEAVVGALLGISHHRFKPARMAHGAALLTITYASGAVAYDLFGLSADDGFQWAMVAAVVAVALVCFGINAGLIAIESRLRTGQDFVDFWDKHAWLAPNYLGLGLLGVALTAAYLALGLAGILAFVAPALMMRLSMKQYVDKTKESVTKLEAQNDALRTANIEIRRVTEELRTSYDGTLEALVNALDARDQETKGHSIRVSRYMLDIAREMGVVEGSEEWVDMQRGSLLHDVGKIGVSDSILLKPSKLTDDEWDLMRKHPEIGYNMLRQVKFLQGPAEIILAHHERWDGRGYPKGLHEDEIPLGARIFSVVDTFDSMTSDRPYRKALTTLDSMNEIMACAGSQFDPIVVEAFLDIYENWVKEREMMHLEEETRLHEAA
jgi:putative nucleotidyltransferase with HDIG domain